MDAEGSRCRRRVRKVICPVAGDLLHPRVVRVFGGSPEHDPTSLRPDEEEGRRLCQRNRMRPNPAVLWKLSEKKPDHAE